MYLLDTDAIQKNKWEWWEVFGMWLKMQIIIMEFRWYGISIKLMGQWRWCGARYVTLRTGEIMVLFSKYYRVYKQYWK